MFQFDSPQPLTECVEALLYHPCLAMQVKDILALCWYELELNYTYLLTYLGT